MLLLWIICIFQRKPYPDSEKSYLLGSHFSIVTFIVEATIKASKSHGYIGRIPLSCDEDINKTDRDVDLARDFSYMYYGTILFYHQSLDIPVWRYSSKTLRSYRHHEILQGWLWFARNVFETFNCDEDINKADNAVEKQIFQRIPVTDHICGNIFFCHKVSKSLPGDILENVGDLPSS